VGATCLERIDGEAPSETYQRALELTSGGAFHALIVDTAGRLVVEDELMAELRDLHTLIQPTETLLVADAMTGQDAVDTANKFNAAVSLSGIILTRTDSDARGGAALSMRHATGVPIKLVGTGERMDALREFNPRAVADRILGDGGVLDVAQQVEQGMSDAEKTKLENNVALNKFDMGDFLVYTRQIVRAGGVANIAAKLPMLSGAMPAGMGKLDMAKRPGYTDEDMATLERITGMMTEQEKQQPDRLPAQRKKQLATELNMELSDLNVIFRRFTHIRDVFRMWKSQQDKAAGQAAAAEQRGKKTLKGGAHKKKGKGKKGKDTQAQFTRW